MNKTNFTGVSIGLAAGLAIIAIIITTTVVINISFDQGRHTCSKTEAQATTVNGTLPEGSYVTKQQLIDNGFYAED